MIPQNCNGMVQTVIDTVKSVQLKMKSKLPMMTDEAREKQIPPNDQLQNGSPCISTGGTESNTDSTSKPGFQSSETQSMVFIRTTSEFSSSTHLTFAKERKQALHWGPSLYYVSKRTGCVGQKNGHFC